MSSSRPGRERSRKRLISSSSRKVPRDAISRNLSPCLFLKSAKYSCGLSSRTLRFPGGTRSARLSARECAGSVETSKKYNCGARAAKRSAAAAAQVVFPTPPFPPKMRSCKSRGPRKPGVSVPLAGVTYASTVAPFTAFGSWVIPLALLSNCFAAPGYLVQTLEQTLLFDRKFFLGELPRFQSHVESAELRRNGFSVGDQLLLGRLMNLPKDPEQTAGWGHQEIIHNKHPALPWLLKFKINIHEVVRSPRPVVIEGEVVIELLGNLAHVSFELRHRVPPDQAGQVHHFALVAAFQALDFTSVAGKHPHRKVRVGFAVFLEKAIEHSSQFDLLFLRGLALRSKESVSGHPEFRMRVDEIFENVGHIPGNSQSHLDLIGNVPELIEEDLLVAREHPANCDRAVRNHSKGHGQGCGFGHQSFQDFVMGRQAGAFRAHVVVGHIADDGGDGSGRDGVQPVPVDAELFVNSVLPASDDGVQVCFLGRGCGLPQASGSRFCNRDMSGTHVVCLRRLAGPLACILKPTPRAAIVNT